MINRLGNKVSSKELAGRLRNEGGFTTSERTGLTPKEGFAVAEFGAERAYPSPGAGPADVEQYRQEYADQLAGPQKFFGGWASGTPEGDFLDVSKVVGSRREALGEGRVHAQRAVMDLATFDEHSVPYEPGLPGPKRTGMGRQEYQQAEGQNRELGRRMIENQLHGRSAAPWDQAEIQARGAAIADDLIAREQLHSQVRDRGGRKSQVKRGRE